MPAALLDERIRGVRARIADSAAAANRNGESITLLAVSKGHETALIAAAARLGLEHFGENYLQEALPKIEALRGMELTWHFLGRLQANKTRAVAEHFAWVHGVDRLRIAERLSQQRPPTALPLNVCIQVNIAADAHKAGITPEEVPALIRAVAPLPRLSLRGFMCVLPESLDDAGRRGAFARLAELLYRLQPECRSLDTLSMGMSADYHEAVAAGATIVRIGTAIFGPRDGANP